MPLSGKRQEDLSVTWTNEQVATLRELWESGKSASEIAQILGDEFSRNAVIGKAHRLRLDGRPSPIGKKPLSLARPAGATLMELTARMCCWPIGDPHEPGFHFCGRRVVGRRSYCADHANLAYSEGKPPKPKESAHLSGADAGFKDCTGQRAPRSLPEEVREGMRTALQTLVDAGISQESISRITGLSRSGISIIRRGVVEPKRGTLLKLQAMRRHLAGVGKRELAHLIPDVPN